MNVIQMEGIFDGYSTCLPLFFRFLLRVTGVPTAFRDKGGMFGTEDREMGVLVTAFGRVACVVEGERGRLVAEEEGWVLVDGRESVSVELMKRLHFPSKYSDNILSISSSQPAVNIHVDTIIHK